MNKKPSDPLFQEHEALIRAVVAHMAKKIHYTLIEPDEMMSIAYMALVKLLRDKPDRVMNKSFKAQAMRWAISNEVRFRKRGECPRHTFYNHDEYAEDDGYGLSSIPSNELPHDEFQVLLERHQALERAIDNLPERAKIILLERINNNTPNQVLGDRFGMHPSRISRTNKKTVSLLQSKLAQNGYNQ